MWQRVSALTNSAADVVYECVCRADEFALSAGVWSWSGTFAKPGAAAGVGPMYLCEGEDGVVQGSYAGLGIIQGVASGNMLRGSWYEAGEGSGSMASHGEVVFTMYRANNSNSVWLVGEWTYGFGSSAVRSTSEWRTMRMSTAVPTARQCFSSTAVGSVLTNGGWAESAPLASWDARLAGRFTVMAGDPPAVFDLCPRSDGSTVGSYTWSLDGNAGMWVARLLTACSLRLTCLCVCVLVFRCAAVHSSELPDGHLLRWCRVVQWCFPRRVQRRQHGFGHLVDDPYVVGAEWLVSGVGYVVVRHGGGFGFVEVG